MQTEIIDAGPFDLEIDYPCDCWIVHLATPHYRIILAEGSTRDAAVTNAVARLDAMSNALQSTPSPESLRAVTRGEEPTR